MAASKPTALQSILAGGAAGGVESLITYPTEYIKTRQQLVTCGRSASSPLSILLKTLKNQGIRPIYTGAGVFCLSNSSKSAVRFAVFDTVRVHLPTDATTEKPLASSNMLAGACAGIAESVTVLTPGENLKTKLIDCGGRSGTGARFTTLQLVSQILETEGVAGLYRGVVPVAMKQCANAIVRFTSYQYLLDRTKSMLQQQDLNNNMIAPAVAGGAAGIITVYATMPFDNIKTRLQALGSSGQYRGTIDCLQGIVKGDGVKGLWKGTTPRLVRLSVSGALSFSVYEQVVALMQLSQKREQLDIRAGVI